TASAARDADEALALVNRVEAQGAVVGILSLSAYGLMNSDPIRALGLMTQAIELSTSLGRLPGPMLAAAAHISERVGNHTDALRSSARALEETHATGNQSVLHPMLRSTGDLLAADAPEAAAILHGAGDRPFPTPDESEHHQAVATIDTALGPSR